MIDGSRRRSSTVTDTLHLRRRDHVDGRLAALEHLEQLAQKAVRHQHARRGDVDDGDLRSSTRSRSAGASTADARP